MAASVSGEMIGVVTVGVALAGLILTQPARLESRLSGRIRAMESQIAELRRRMANLEGLPEGLREAITRRVAG